MAANVETMFSVREKPWHGLGQIVQEAPTSADALRLAGLDWTVDQTAVKTESGIIIPNYKANVRSTDGKVLGIVTDRYKIVQNTEAFEFTDAVVGETNNGVVTYETAGSLAEGKRVWMLAKMPTKNVAGDAVEPYMVFTNSHDGSGAIKVAMTPIRVVCQNTLSVALSGAQRSWSTKHVGNIEDKLEEAKMCLGLADKYMSELAEQADKWAEQRLYKEQVDEILEEIFPINEEDSDRKKENAKEARNAYYYCYMRPDISQFFETAWGAINAMSDFVGHSTPNRRTKNYEANRFGKIIDGHPLMEKFVDLVNQKVGA